MEALLINLIVFGTIYAMTFWIAKLNDVVSPRSWAAGVTIVAAVAAHFFFGM